MSPVAIDTIYPLTKPQELIYHTDRFLGEGNALICGSMLVHGTYSPSELTAAANRLISSNDALRIRLSKSAEGQPVQYVSNHEDSTFPILSLPSKEALHKYGEGWAKELLPTRGALFQIQILQLPEHSGFLIKLHHLIADAWTLSLLASQLLCFLKGEQPVVFSYMDYIHSQQSYPHSKRYLRDREFFHQQFLKCEEVTYLSEKQSNRYCSERNSHIIAGPEAAQICAYAAQRETSPFVLFLTALSIYVSRIKMNRECFFIGTTVLNRNNIRDKHTAGMFIHTVPLLIELDYSASFHDNLKAVEEAVFSTFRHQSFHYGDTLEMLRKEHQFKEQLYDITLSYQNAAISGEKAEFESAWYPCAAQAESLQIHIEDRDAEGVFRMHYDYLTDKFSRKEIDALHTRLVTLLFDAISSDKAPGDLALLSEREKTKILKDFNNTSEDFPSEYCIHEWIRHQACQTPDRLAVQDRYRSLTYRQLEQESDRIASGLRNAGICPGDMVAFALPKKCILISVMLGILKAGAAYLPIDSGNPPERIRMLLEQSNSRLYITEENVDTFLADDMPPSSGVTPDALCYGISTSGSTGTPKIVLIRHRNIVNTILWKLRCTPSASLTTLCISPITADTFTEDVLFSLLSGRPLRLCDRDKLTEVADLIAADPRCAIMTTPTLFNALRSLMGDKDQLQEVTLVGESLIPQFVQKIKHQVKTLYNEYGPSECAVCATRSQISFEDEIITIGRPISNVQVYILDRQLQPVPIGAVGELCIAGCGVGCGYLGQRDLTDAVFIANPYGPGKLYKTGDLACFREDGSILFMGRNDFQVKIRGLRIEIEEIEKTIASVPGILESAVVVRRDKNERQVICAFYSEESPVELTKIKKAVTDKLPRYMLPHIFTKLDRLPGTSSGKINRKALPEVDLHSIARHKVYEAPQGMQEQLLAELWENVLEYTPVGRNDHFFDVGGDSLKAIELISRAQSLGVSLSLQSIFDFPTVRELSLHLQKNTEEPGASDHSDFLPIHDLLSHNHSLSENGQIPITPMGNIFLTGATGYLGAHLLSEFLNRQEGVAYCLIRGDKESHCVKRLHSVLHSYFGNKYSQEIGNRIHIIPGDLQKESFGIPQESYHSLLSQVQTVIHTAANVKHYGSYESFYAANVETVDRIIDFASAAGARLIHASTTSITGKTPASHKGATPMIFSEQNLYVGQALDNVYVRSKFEAEKRLLAARLRGLPVHIMRIGNLTNRRTDGVFQSNQESNAFLARIKAILETGLVPLPLVTLPIEFTPVDEAAVAIMTLAEHFDPRYTVFHICNPYLISMEQLLAIFSRCGYPTRIISDAEFADLIQNPDKPSATHQLIAAFLPDMGQDHQLHYERNIQPDSSFTLSRLRSLGYEWTPVDENYIQKYISYYQRNGFFEVVS